MQDHRLAGYTGRLPKLRHTIARREPDEVHRGPADRLAADLASARDEVKSLTATLGNLRITLDKREAENKRQAKEIAALEFALREARSILQGNPAPVSGVDVRLGCLLTAICDGSGWEPDDLISNATGSARNGTGPLRARFIAEAQAQGICRRSVAGQYLGLSEDATRTLMGRHRG